MGPIHRRQDRRFAREQFSGCTFAISWIAVSTRQVPVSGNLESGHRVATVCHLANLSLKLGRRLRWDCQARSGDRRRRGQQTARPALPFALGQGTPRSWSGVTCANHAPGNAGHGSGECAGSGSPDRAGQEAFARSLGHGCRDPLLRYPPCSPTRTTVSPILLTFPGLLPDPWRRRRAQTSTGRVRRRLCCQILKDAIVRGAGDVRRRNHLPPPRQRRHWPICGRSAQRQGLRR